MGREAGRTSRNERKKWPAEKTSTVFFSFLKTHLKAKGNFRITTHSSGKWMMVFELRGCILPFFGTGNRGIETRAGLPFFKKAS